MALRHAILAALLEGPASGYELSKRFDVSVANYWPATPQQLYREVERMESDAVVSAEVVQQDRRPNKRVFTITDTGRDELIAFTAIPPRPSALRDELLVKLAAVDIGDRDAVIAALEDRHQQALGKLALYDRLQEGVLKGRSEDQLVASGDRIGPYLTLLRGISFEAENVAFIERALALLGRAVDTT